MHETSLYWLDQIQPAQRTVVGDKAFYLAMLSQRQHPVLPGVVIPADWLRQFLEQVQWSDPMFAELPHSSLHVDVDNARQLQTVAQQIRQAVMATPVPPDWLAAIEAAAQSWQTDALILRPSFALPLGTDPTLGQRTTGLLESQICWFDRQALAQALKQVWVQLFRARSLLYWQRLDIQIQQINLAVLVQPLRPVEASGKLQIQETSQGTAIEVQAIWGLGQGLVTGHVPPESCHIPVHHGIPRFHRQPSPYFYQLASRPTATAALTPSPVPSSVPSPVEAAESPWQHSCLQLCSLEQAQPDRIAPDGVPEFVLPPAQLKQLLQLAHQIMVDLGMAVELEWVRLRSDEENTASAALYLTQVLPRFDVMKWREWGMWQPSILNAIDRIDPMLSPEPFPTAPPLPEPVPEASSHLGAESISPSPPFGDAPSGDAPSRATAPPLTGLAAAPGKAFAPAWVVERSTRLPAVTEIPTGVILVAPALYPDWLVFLRQMVGVVTEAGGITSHGAILARELGIPAVVGLAHATERLQTGDYVFVDGDRGEVYPVTSRADLPGYLAEPVAETEAAIELAPALEAESSLERGHRGTVDRPAPEVPWSPVSTPLLPPIMMAPIATQLWVTLNQSDRVAALTGLPIDGVGLLRSELALLELLDYQHPHRWIEQNRTDELVQRMADRLCWIADALLPRPIFYRAFDWRSHEFAALEGSPAAEPNPMLGLRGTFTYQLQPELLDLQLAALRQAQRQGYANLRLLLPFVRTVEEFIFCRDRVAQAGLRQVSEFQLWIMAEVPSVLYLLPDYITAGVQGIAIGLNDLTQLMLGVDRDQPQLAPMFNPSHPAVQRAIRQLIRIAHTTHLPCSICGYLPHQQEWVDQLVRDGITAISVEPQDVTWMYQAIVRAEHRLLIEGARS